MLHQLIDNLPKPEAFVAAELTTIQDDPFQYSVYHVLHSLRTLNFQLDIVPALETLFNTVSSYISQIFAH